MANPNEWGPLVWKILHVLSEKFGSNTNTILQNDELNAFDHFVKDLIYILPCPMCRKHYKEYYKLHYKKNIKYTDLKNFSKKYFYNLHDEINKSKNNESPPFDLLTEIYGYTSKDKFIDYLKEYTILFNKYILNKYIHSEDVKKFVFNIKYIRIIINY